MREPIYPAEQLVSCVPCVTALEEQAAATQADTYQLQYSVNRLQEGEEVELCAAFQFPELLLCRSHPSSAESVRRR